MKPSTEDPLSIYLHDHLAGSHFAVELLETLVASYPTETAGSVAASVLKEVEKDQETLQQIVKRVGTSHFDLKDASSWLAEKVSRLKLRHEDAAGLGAFEAFETLSIGILGKQSLWHALSVVAVRDPRITDFNYEALADRAREQFEKVEAFRLSIAAVALGRESGSGSPP